MTEPDDRSGEVADSNDNHLAKSFDVTPIVTVSVVSVGALGLSVFTAAVMAVLIAFGLTYFGYVEVAANATLDEKLEAVSRVRSVSIAAGVLGTSATLFFMALWTSLRPGPGFSRRMRLRSPSMIHLVLVTLGMLALTQALSGIIYLLQLDKTGNLAEFNAVFQSWDTQKRLLMLPVLALCPGIAEELFFRGYAFSRVEHSHGWIIAAGLSALLFGLIHLDPIHSVAATIMGLYLAFAVRVTGSIWTTIFAHIVNNTAAVMFPTLTPDDTFFQAVWVSSGLLITALVTFLLWRVKRPALAPPW